MTHDSDYYPIGHAHTNSTRWHGLFVNNIYSHHGVELGSHWVPADLIIIVDLTWVCQVILEVEACMQMYIMAVIQERLIPVDSRIDAFKRQVQKSLNTT